MNNESKVKLQLSIQKQKSDSYIIGSTINSVFIEVPEEAVAIIEYCDGNRSVKEIQELLHNNKNIDIDVLDFLKTLEDMELIYSIDGSVCNEVEDKSYPLWLIRLSNILFNKYTAVIYALIFILDFILIIFNRNLIPKYEDAFFIENRIGINMIVYFVITCIITVLHELGHFLSIVRLNIKSKFSLSLRLMMLVVQADINGLWSVEKKKRYFSYFAGICVENIIMLIAIFIKLSCTNKLCTDIASTVILIIILNFFGEFMIFLRNDLYLVLLTYFDMSGLYEYSKEYLKIKFFKSKQRDVWDKLSGQEKKYVKLFSLTYIFGVAFSVIWLCFEVPIVLYTIYEAIEQILSKDLKLLFDGLLIIIVIVIDVALWIKGALNKRRENQNQVLA